MGFSVTVAHVIFAVALLAGGSTLAATYHRADAGVTDARRVDADLRDAAVHTAIDVVTQSWSPPNNRITFNIDNEGTTTLDVRKLEFVVDGAWATDKVETWTVDAVSTNWWAPETTLTVSLRPFADEPADVVITTEYGTKAYWRR